MKNRTKVATFAAVALVTGGVVAGAVATTFAWFSATGKGADSQVAAATVALGRGGGSVALAYKDLKPGVRQVTQLTVSYQGSVPADVTLEITPSGSPSLCVQHAGQWKSRPGGAVTVAIGSGAPVSYCDLLNGRVLPLASAMRPRSERKIDVAVMLSRDANENLRGLAEKDVATVRAKGGFTDHVAGTISITTAGLEKRDKDKDGVRREDVPPALLDPARKLDPPLIAVAPGALPPGPVAGAPSGRAPVVLPAECAQAGMRLEGFEDVIVLGPNQHTWKAPERGQGSGPFLIVGTDGDDEIVGSEGTDCIVGGGGNDTLAGGAGNDVLIGGAGADRLDGGLGNDWLFGGPGVDELRGGGGIDRFDGGPDGAVCDAGHDAATAIHCQAPPPPASSSTTSSKKERGAPEVATPTTTSPPLPSPPATPSAPAPTTAPASASSTPPATPPAQASSPTAATPPHDDPAHTMASSGTEQPPAATRETLSTASPSKSP